MLGAWGVGIKLSLTGVSGSLHMGFFKLSITSPSPASGTAVKVKVVLRDLPLAEHNHV